MSLTILNEDEFYENIKEGLVLIDFGADWCSPCVKFTPVLEQFAATNSNVKVFKIDSDECPGLIKKYKIKSVPHVLLFSDGKLIYDKAGMMTLSQLNELIK